MRGHRLRFGERPGTRACSGGHRSLRCSCRCSSQNGGRIPARGGRRTRYPAYGLRVGRSMGTCQRLYRKMYSKTVGTPNQADMVQERVVRLGYTGRSFRRTQCLCAARPGCRAIYFFKCQRLPTAASRCAACQGRRLAYLPKSQ